MDKDNNCTCYHPVKGYCPECAKIDRYLNILMCGAVVLVISVIVWGMW